MTPGTRGRATATLGQEDVVSDNVNVVNDIYHQETYSSDEFFSFTRSQLECFLREINVSFTKFI